MKGERERKREKEGVRESTSLGGSVSRGRIVRVPVCVVRVVDDRVGRDFAQAELYSWGSRPRTSDQSPPSRDSTVPHGMYPHIVAVVTVVAIPSLEHPETGGRHVG